MNILDKISEFATENHLVACGIVGLVGAFLLVFFFKDIWGRWADKYRKDKY